jgi:hypothetical protein
LDHFLVFVQRHFDHIVTEYVDYYHDCRPHQGIGNALLTTSRAEADRTEPDVASLDLSKIKCERRRTAQALLPRRCATMGFAILCLKVENRIVGAC